MNSRIVLIINARGDLSERQYDLLLDALLDEFEPRIATQIVDGSDSPAVEEIARQANYALLPQIAVSLTDILPSAADLVEDAVASADLVIVLARKPQKSSPLAGLAIRLAREYEKSLYVFHP